MITAETIAQALSCGQCPKCNKKAGAGFLTHCPLHDDPSPSLSVTDKDGKILVHCHAGCEGRAVIEALKSRNLWPIKEKKDNGKDKIIATYDYHDAQGVIIFQSCRMEPKDFRQRRPDGKGGWIWKMTGVSLVPYHLPEILTADQVFVVEGEKDADRLIKLGLVATTNPMGAGKWRSVFNTHFKGRTVIIIPDNDEPGKVHAQTIASNLYGLAKSVKIVELPGVPKKGDVFDWLSAGGTKEGLLGLIEETPEWKRVHKVESRFSADEELSLEAQKSILIADIGEELGIPLESVARVGGDDVKYIFRIKDTDGHMREILMSVPQLTSFLSFRNKVVALCKKMLFKIKDKEWAQIVQKILDAADDLEPGPEASMSGDVENALRAYLVDQNPSEGWNDGHPFLHKGKLNISLTLFSKYLKLNHNAILSNNELAQWLKIMGCEDQSIKLSGVTRRSWIVPDPFVPVKSSAKPFPESDYDLEENYVRH